MYAYTGLFVSFLEDNTMDTSATCMRMMLTLVLGIIVVSNAFILPISTTKKIQPSSSSSYQVSPHNATRCRKEWSPFLELPSPGPSASLSISTHISKHTSPPRHWPLWNLRPSSPCPFLFHLPQPYVFTAIGLTYLSFPSLPFSYFQCK